jgi:heme-binding NEAT domain protein
MPVTITPDNTRVVTFKVSNLTPPGATTVSVIIEDINAPVPVQIPLLDPADAYAIGTAFRNAAQKAGYAGP